MVQIHSRRPIHYRELIAFHNESDTILSMNKTAATYIEQSQKWLSQDVFPLWIKQGVDRSNGGFIENLSYDGKPLNISRRAMVQARQIYSFVVGAKLNSCPMPMAHEIVKNAEVFFRNYWQDSGACSHVVSHEGKVENESAELYTQAFALFALANVYEVTEDANSKSQLKKQALKLLSYLQRERRAPGGGYTEIKNGKVLFQSNPHMHLFEAAVAWMQVDSSSEWKALAKELFDLAQSKFIDSSTGLLCEHFQEGWIPERSEGKFIFEPGHHFEWAWLLAVYEGLSGTSCKALRHSLFQLAEKNGVNPQTHLAYDEVWSDLTPKKKSSRFWPHCERIKAAVKLGVESPKAEQKAFAKSADEAMKALFIYLETSTKGLWQDTLLENGEFTHQDPKASSLYHIINAMYEYINLRPNLLDGE